ncbi:hypothetical protein DOM22_01780 [Bdellovibrio sp. ZAP7]|uniref:hypothetical protein n=1 Tax=Bdellovibrio sp. ZAP7 TaxID=2231053 RepID=UPI001158E0A7|nr:hypothetical protein [Bdellovibrio sp. ZAP7]QDK43978.1 hypothetical protein DOM22_01780 [Bdellovibrio sp. ZAP7]
MKIASSLTMQKNWFNIFISVAIFLATGCSFKKEKLVQTDAVNTSSGEMLLSLESFSTKTDDEVIQHLSKMPNESLEKNEALDWSIINARLAVINYLLSERGLSPFSYSEQSVHILATNSKLKSLVYAFQEPEIFQLVEHLYAEKNPRVWEETLSRMNIKTTTCSNIFEKMMDMYFYVPNSNSQKYIGKIDSKNVVDSYYLLSGTSTCSSIKELIPTSSFEKWYVAELKTQYFSKFSSTTLIEFFNSISAVQNLSLDLSTPKGTIRIDPVAYILAGMPDMEEMSLKQRWIDMVSPRTSKSPLFYNIQYTPCSAENNATDEDPICEKANFKQKNKIRNLIQHVFNTGEAL